MSLNPSMNGNVDYAPKIKVTGRLAIGCNAFAMFGVLLFDYQSGGHGEMGSFYHENLVWILLFSGWGLATGIGLLRAWRWARISTLIFSGLLVALGNPGCCRTSAYARRRLQLAADDLESRRYPAFLQPCCAWDLVAGFL